MKLTITNECALTWWLAALVFVYPATGFSYERATHARISNAAVDQSRLAGNSSLLQQLGLFDLEPSNLFGSNYYDVTGNLELLRTAKDYEANRILQATGHLPLALEGWIMRGAIREDDTPLVPGERDNNPQDNPFPPERYRPLHHFFDPYHNTALTSAGCLLEGTCKRSPDWALGSTSAFASPPPPDGARLNHFTIIDAHEAMWRAVTGTRFSDGGPVNPAGSTSAQTDRLAYWATTFRALGDVIHHIQDMAQPQHTRNDAHSGLGCDPSEANCPFGHASYYEKYIDARATGRDVFEVGNSLEGEKDVVLPALDYLDKGNLTLAVPNFTRYSDYWSTGQLQQSLTGRGMADYSSRGFYSAGTNIGSTAGQSFPQPDASMLTDSSLPAGEGVSLSGKVLNEPLPFKVGAVQDYVGGVPDTGIRQSTYSVFDQFLQQNGLPLTYSLNYYIYNDQARLLLPRAAAYSAGLLNFFFRGNMSITLPDEGVYSIVDHSKFGPPPGTPTNASTGIKGFAKLRLKLTNTTAPITPPGGTEVKQAMTGGKLVAVFKFHRNNCYQDDLNREPIALTDYANCLNPVEEVVVSDPLLDNRQVPFDGDSQNPNGKEFEFDFPQELPINAWNVVLQVVYRGTLGSEDDAVVVTTKDVSEPTFISVYNDTDYILINGVCYLPGALTSNSPQWPMITPTCKNGNVLSSACYNLPIAIRYTFGSAPTPVVVAMEQNGGTDGRVQAGRFGRFAVIGDVGTPLNAPYTFAGIQPYQPAVYVADQHVQIVQINGHPARETQTLANLYTPVRGIKTWYGIAIIIDGTTGAAGAASVGSVNIGSGCPDNNFAPLTPTNPQGLTITGW